MAKKWNGSPDDFPHGTTRGYRLYGCRESACGCREAHVEDIREWRRRNGVKETTNRQEAVHGSRSMYRKCESGPDGKPCDPCTQANRDYQRVYMRFWRSGVPFVDSAIEDVLRDV